MKRLAFILLVASCAHPVPKWPASDARVVLLHEAMAAHDSGHYREARAKWIALAQSANDPALELAAAGKLLALDGEAGAEKELLAQLRALAPRVHPEARDLLLDLADRLARRAGDPASAEIEAQRGCVREWRVTPRLGALPHVDLEKSPPPGEARTIAAHGCRAQLYAPDARFGALAAILPPAQSDSLVMIDAQADWILVRAGKVLYRHGDRARYPARVEWLRVRGNAAPLELRLAAANVRIDVAAVIVPADHEPDHAAEAVAPPEPPLPGDDAALVAAWIALGRGHADRVDELLDGRHDAPAMIARASAATIDPSRSYSTTRERARSFLEQALAADPHTLRAAYNLALLDLQDDRAREAMARLEENNANATFWGWHALYAQALRQKGLTADADRALARARELDPDVCGLAEQDATAARDHHDPAAERRAAEAHHQCDAETQALADLCSARGDHECAIAEYERLLAADPARDGLRLPLSESLIAKGDTRRAIDVLTKLVYDEPRQASYRLRLADAYVAAGDSAQAKRVLHDATAAMPESIELWRALEAMGEPHPLAPFRVDGRGVIREFEARKVHPASDDAPAVVLLDRTVTRAFATGARLTLTHNIIRVQSKSAIDRWGEVQVPAGADVLLLRTVKSDGTTREPEEIAEKESISVPDLLPGDYVEFEYVTAAPPPAAFPDGFLAERFYFVSFDDPLDRTEYVVAVPAGTAVDIDPRGGMNKLQKKTRAGDLDVYTWGLREQRRRIAEPGETPYVENAPSVRVSSQLSFSRWRAFLIDATAGSWRRNTELAGLAQRECKGKSQADCVRALDAWTQDNVEHGGLFTDAATAILGRRQGNRTSLLAALLAAAGIEPDIWLIRPMGADQTTPVAQELDDFDQPVLKLRDGFVDPRPRRLDAFAISPLLVGSQAIHLSADGFEKVAPTRDPAEGNRKLTLSADANGHVDVRENLSGWLSVEWRDLKDQTDQSRLRQDFEQRSLGFFFPGAQLESLDLRGFNERGRGPVEVEYKFTAPRLLIDEGGGRTTLAPLFPSLLVRRYIVLPSRTRALQLGITPPTDLDATIALPRGARVQTPPPVDVKTPFGRFSSRVSFDKGVLHIQRHLEMPLRRVEPADYAAFIAFARAVDEAEEARVSIELHASRNVGASPTQVSASAQPPTTSMK